MPPLTILAVLVTEVPEQITPEGALFVMFMDTGRVGLTVILKDCAFPEHELADGVTVMVATKAALPEFVAVNDEILPVPLAARPMDVVLFVQLYEAPATEPVKAIGETTTLLHKTWLETLLTTGVGLTVIVNVCAEPLQLFARGVTLRVAVRGEDVVLATANDAILPVPLAARPMDVVLFVQL